MKRISSCLSVLAIAAIAAPAAADVTAAELWADWQENAAAAGSPIAAEVSAGAGGLTLSEMTWSIPPTAPGDPAVSLVFDDIEMINQADGSVSVVMTSPFQVAVSGEDPGGESFGANFDLTFDAMNLTATGSLSDLTYTFSSSPMQFVLVEILGVSPEEMPDVTVEMNVGATEGMFRYFDAGQDRNLETSLSSGPATFLMDILPPPGETGRVTASFEMGASRATSTGVNATLFQSMMASAGSTIDPSKLPTLSSEGSYDSLSYDFNVDVPGTQFSAVGSNGGGHIDSGIGPDGVSFDIGATDAVIALRGSDLPVPIDVTAGATGVALSFPAVAGPDPQPFGMALDYRDVAVSETLWSMIDPGQAIARTPITLQVDISGMAQMFADLINMDPMTLAGPPGELRSVSLNTLNVSAVGATLTGSGAAEFQPGAFPPMPVGSVDLGLQGLNGVLDSLTAAGLLPIEQAGMVRAMTGMFARPGAGPDTLETTIEFLPGGGITANGIPLQ